MTIANFFSVLFGAIVMSPMILAAWANQNQAKARERGFPIQNFIVKTMIKKMLGDLPKTLVSFLVAALASPAFVKAFEYAASTVGVKIQIDQAVFIPFLLTLSSASITGITNFLKQHFPNQLGNIL